MKSNTMKTKTITAGIWGVDKVRFSYNDTTLEMYGQTFRIERLPAVTGIEDFQHYKVTDESGNSFGVTKWGNEPFMAVTDSIVSEGDNLHSVIAVMIANLY
mgnify:CR=1 FL=1